MKLTKPLKITLITSVIVIAASLTTLFFIIPYYKIKRMANVETLTEAMKLAKDVDVIYFLKNFGTAVWKMSNSEINTMYKYVYYYVKNNITAPDDFIEKFSIISTKYNLFPDSITGRKKFTCWNGYIFYNGLLSNREC